MQLHHANNLTKTLGFNSYNLAYTPTAAQRSAWQDDAATRYGCERLTQLLTELATRIDANILNIAQQTYEPQGASVTMLVSEQHNGIVPHSGLPRENEYGSGALPEHVVMHLDKSHLTVHTYPESDPLSGISTVRVDIDVSTCGRISPLMVMNYLLRSFEPDIVTADYRVRGYTRDIGGRKHFTDHAINSIQDFVSADILRYYQAEDSNLHRESLFYTKLMLKHIVVDKYLFGQQVVAHEDSLQSVERSVCEEMADLFHARG